MKYYSTNHKSQLVSLKEAVMKGLADDGGLFMPEKIPQLSSEFFKALHSRPLQDISFDIAKVFFGEDIPENILENITRDAINFEAPLVKLSDKLFVLELFHGPTLAFKDFAARFMARLMSYFNQDEKQELVVLVATSGDTGSAVASGFYNVPGIRVVILYPSGKVTDLQEKQLTTMGGNITALEIQGDFDDCLRLSKQAFQDTEVTSRLQLTSANSINVARLLPQVFYYFWAYAQLESSAIPVVLSVPCGNLGNITAGLIAKRMGLPIHQFIAASNVNDVVPSYLRDGSFEPHPSRATISNSMDVGNPVSFVRMLELYDHEVEKMRKDVVGYRFTDDDTRQAIKEVYEKFCYVLDPHGAVGYLGLKTYQDQRANSTGIFLETAHPAKFLETVQETIGKSIEIPERLAEYAKREKVSVKVSNEYEGLKEFLLGTL